MARKLTRDNVELLFAATGSLRLQDIPYDGSNTAKAILDAKNDAPSEGAFVDGDKTKLDGIEAGADVTDATNVNAAGATMNTDTTLAGNSWFLDEDNMASNDATKVPSQQSVKAYVDGVVAAAVILQGDWNASTNTPDITGTTTTGHAWRVSVAGSTDLGGITDWAIGDLAVKTATGWLKIDNGDIAAVWGNITGTLSNQTDLQSALDAKQDEPAEGPFVDGDKTKLDGIEAGADVTDLANVTTAVGVTAAVAVTDTGTAGNAGKLIKLDGSGLLDGRNIDVDGTKLDGIEAGADVTDATNVDAAGATMNADTDVSANGWVVDEDTMVSNLATKVPTQQSVKAYVDAQTTNDMQQELHTVTAGEVTAGFFTLTGTPDSAIGVKVEALDGVTQLSKQTIGIGATTPDFDVLNGDDVHINNNGAATGLSGNIVENDVLLITYLGTAT